MHAGNLCTGMPRQKGHRFRACLGCIVRKTNMAGEVAQQVKVLVLTSLVT